MCLAIATPLMLPASPAAAADGFQQVTKYQHDWWEGDLWWSGMSRCVEANNGRGVACFMEKGDLLGVIDLRSDGRRVGVRWKTSDGRKGLCVNARGQDDAENWSRTGAAGYWLCDKRFDKGIKVTIRTGVCDASKENCKKLKNWYFGPQKKVPNKKVN